MTFTLVVPWYVFIGESRPHGRAVSAGIIWLRKQARCTCRTSVSCPPLVTHYLTLVEDIYPPSYYGTAQTRDNLGKYLSARHTPNSSHDGLASLIYSTISTRTIKPHRRSFQQETMHTRSFFNSCTDAFLCQRC
jgi:hypothetical protein